MKIFLSAMKNRNRSRAAAVATALGLAYLALAAPVAVSAQDVQTWNTFLGGAGWDTGRAIASDRGGNVYVAGIADGSWGSPVRAYTARNDAFVAKLDKTGKIVWTTFLGGTGTDNVYGIAVDPAGSVCVAGTSNASWGSPVTPMAAGFDAFAAKLDGKGQLLWNTFLGGAGTDQANGLAVDAEGNVTVVGSSTDGWGAPEGEYWAGPDAFAARLDSGGRRVWNTFLGGNGEDYGRGVALDASGNSFFVGYSTATWGVPTRGYSFNNDAFAAELDANGHLYWNTFLGGDGYETGTGIAVDRNGFACVTGFGNSSWGIPIVALTGGYDAFLAKLDTTGTVVWNTFIGGDARNYGDGVAVDGNGFITVAGHGLTTWGSPLRDSAGGYDAFLVKLDGDGNAIWHTFLGGTGDDFIEGVALDSNRNILLVGVSDAGWGTPVRAFSANYDAFAALVPETPAPAAVVSVSASPREDRIELRWETSREADLAGFKVWRRAASDAGFERLTGALIPAKGGAEAGSSYIFADGAVTPGETYAYEIETVDLRDRSFFLSPVSAVAAAIRLLSPAPGAVVLPGAPLRFAWDARGPLTFKIELSTEAGFTAARLVLPGRGDGIEAKTYTPARAEMDLVRRLATAGRIIYWRVRGRLADGKDVVSDVRWFALRTTR